MDKIFFICTKCLYKAKIFYSHFFIQKTLEYENLFINLQSDINSTRII